MRGRSLVLSLSLVVAGILVVWAAAQNPAASASMFGPSDYTATMVMQASESAAPQRMQVARHGSMWRIQIAMPGRGEGETVTQLVDFASRTAYMMMPQMCMKMAMPNLAPADVLQQAEQHHAKVVDMGPATVTIGNKDYACKHLQITSTEQGKTTVSDIYTANELQNLPVKMVMAQDGKTTTVTYEDIQLTPPPAEQFTPPTNCRTMPAMPGRGTPGMGMGNMPGMPMR